MLALRSVVQLLPSIGKSVYIRGQPGSSPSRLLSGSCALPAVKMEQVNTSKRLAHLRDLMKQHDVDVYGMFLHCG